MEEADAVTFRRTTHLPLNDCLFTLKRFIPHLTRFSLHCLYQWYDISRLPQKTGSLTKGQAFSASPIGCLHLDICEVRTGEGRASLFVEVDRTSKFIHVRLYQKVNRDQAAAFPEDAQLATTAAVRRPVVKAFNLPMFLRTFMCD